jgi:hypothetical protein
MLGFWCLFIAVLVWDNGTVKYLNTILMFGIVLTILGAFFLLRQKTYTAISWWIVSMHLRKNAETTRAYKVLI